MEVAGGGALAGVAVEEGDGAFDSLNFLGIVLTWAIKSFTELTECTEKNNKNSVISAGSVREKKGHSMNNFISKV